MNFYSLNFVNIANYLKLKEIPKLDTNRQSSNCAIFMPVITFLKREPHHKNMCVKPWIVMERIGYMLVAIFPS